MMMNDADGTLTEPGSSRGGFWERIPVLIPAVLLGFLVFVIAGVVLWTAILILVPAPWSFAVTALMLWAYLKYCSGSWWPAASRAFRRTCFRAGRMSAKAWIWSMTAGLLLAFALQAGLVVAFRIVQYDPAVWTLGIDFSEVSAWQVWLYILAAATVAGVTEEVGFRGYMQVPLEKRYGPAVAIVVVSVIFTVAHLNQAWAGGVLVILFAISALWGILARVSSSIIPGIISHSLTDVVNFSYWWTDVAGRFEMQPVSVTGFDEHFLIWLAALVGALVLFFLAVWQTGLARRMQVSSAGPRA